MMKYSTKELFSEINQRTMSNSDEFLNNAISIINNTIENLDVDNVFLDEYYKLKRSMKFRSIFSSTVVLGLVIGLLSSIASTFVDIPGTLEVSECENYGSFIALVIFAFLTCGFLILNGLNKYNCILRPYLVKKMEEKIACNDMEYIKPTLTKKSCKCINEFTKFVKNNRILSIITFIATVITVSYTMTCHLPEIIPGAGKWYKLLSDLSVGVIINFIFYIFQIYIPQREMESKSFPAIKHELILMMERMQEIILVLNYYHPEFKKGEFHINNSLVYYMMQADSNIRKGFSRQFDLYHDFSRTIKSVNDSLEKLLSSIFLQSCDKELIQLLGHLKMNRFLSALMTAEKDRFDPSGIYGDIKKHYPEFIDIYEKLKPYADGYNVRYLTPLSNDEIEKYFSEDKISKYRDKGIFRIYIDSTKN